jgi:hypothetical protein
VNQVTFGRHFSKLFKTLFPIPLQKQAPKFERDDSHAAGKKPHSVEDDQELNRNIGNIVPWRSSVTPNCPIVIRRLDTPGVVFATYAEMSLNMIFTFTNVHVSSIESAAKI